MVALHKPLKAVYQVPKRLMATPKKANLLFGAALKIHLQVLEEFPKPEIRNGSQVENLHHGRLEIAPYAKNT